MPFLKPCFKRSIHAEKGEPDASPSSPGTQTIAFHYGRERGVMVEDVDETQMYLLSLLDGQHLLGDIVTLLQQRDPAVTAEDVSAVLDQLTRYGLLEDASVLPPANLTSEELERYTSQLHFLSLLDPTGTQKYTLQSRIKNARVAVLGLGGLGGQVLLGLAALGIGFLRGVDFDLVELSNLNRQTLYDCTDIGVPKAQAAAQHLAKVNPNVIFEAVQHKIERPEDIVALIQDVDLVAFCADLPRGIRLWMNQAALATGIPFITGGYRGTVAEIGPFVIPYETDCLACFQSRSSDDRAIPELAWIEDAFWLRHPNIHFLTALAAHLTCSEICSYITRIRQPATCNAVYRMDSEQFTLSPTVWPSRPSYCRVCGRRQPSASPNKQPVM